MTIHRTALSFVFAVIGLLALWAMLAPTAVNGADSPGGTIPPVAPFDKWVEPDIIHSNERITFTIRIRNEITPVYSATIGITDTFLTSTPLLILSGTASSGEVDFTNEMLTWVGDIQDGAEIAISYAITAPSTVTETKVLTNIATLYEIRNYFVLTPTSQVTETILEVKVHPWELFLPMVASPKSVLPQLRNPGFEDQPNLAWVELVDGRPGKLIYSLDEFYRPLRDGTHYAWLGGAPNQENKLEQSIQLPKDYDQIGLRFYYWLYSEEDDCNNDLASVRVNGLALTGGDFQLCKQNGTYQPGNPDGWKRALLDLSAYRGQDVKIAFWSKLNGSKNSNFLLDVVELCSNDADAPSEVQRCE